MYKTTLLNLGIPKTLPHTPSSGSVQVNQDKDLFKGLRDAYWSDDEEDRDCPLCLDEMDISDLNFKPCPCGYQICRFCWHRIKENLNRKCPACRREYTNEGAKFQPVAAEDVKRIERQKKSKEKEKKELDNLGRSRLADVRVIQRSLAYVVGWPQSFSEEMLPLLKSPDYFGQYGRILKLSLTKRPPSSHSISDSPIVGIYILYQRSEDALLAINCVDGVNLIDPAQGGVLRASYGTSKYCTNYLRNIFCSDPNCSLLHEPADENDSFTKEDLTSSSFPAGDTGGAGGFRRPFANAAPLPTPPPPQHYYQNSHHFNQNSSTQHNQPNYNTPTIRRPQIHDIETTHAQQLPKSASWAKPGSQPTSASTASTITNLPTSQFPTPSQSSHLSSIRRTPVSSNPPNRIIRPQFQSQNSNQSINQVMRSNANYDKPLSRPSSVVQQSSNNQSPDLNNLIPKQGPVSTSATVSPTGPPPGLSKQSPAPPPPGLSSKPITMLPPGLSPSLPPPGLAGLSPHPMPVQPMKKSRDDEIDDVLSLFKSGGNDFSFSMGVEDNNNALHKSPLQQSNLSRPVDSQNVLSSVSYLFGNDPSISYMSTYDHFQRKQVSQQRNVQQPSVQTSPGPIYTGAFNPFDETFAPFGSFPNSQLKQQQQQQHQKQQHQHHPHPQHIDQHSHSSIDKQFEQMNLAGMTQAPVHQPHHIHHPPPPPPPPGLRSFGYSQDENIRRSSRFDFARSEQQLGSFEDPAHDLLVDAQPGAGSSGAPSSAMMFEQQHQQQQQRNSPALSRNMVNGPPPGITGPPPGLGNNSPMPSQASTYDIPFQDPAIMSMSSPSPHAELMFAQAQQQQQQQQQQVTPTPHLSQIQQPPPGFGMGMGNATLNQLFNIPANSPPSQSNLPPPGLSQQQRNQDDARAQLYSLLQGRANLGGV
ncbi:hypothetical protein E3P81_03188 [Wallemia ichthyophaga]|nr:hypothetical protein E3P97_03268 [Wallemia ichthyophaga]TIB30049.1 hypothetical protein E3P85_02898 [Wallemia ichthyophaga]TIB44975.1 hypothetical protein E3P82_03229 [Wallemia ichthyophaga]TIB47640.1 hypothetical protein E3P81_03188 [Wallemia ichthyophaga]TIB50760.1 hypothetical protein E3P80_03197 [Wallemia ichthyophaga]